MVVAAATGAVGADPEPFVHRHRDRHVPHRFHRVQCRGDPLGDPWVGACLRQIAAVPDGQGESAPIFIGDAGHRHAFHRTDVRHTGCGREEGAQRGRARFANEIEGQRLDLRCLVDGQIHAAVLLFAEPPATRSLDVVAIQGTHDFPYRGKGREADRMRDGVDQTGGDLQVGLTEPVVHRVNQ
ncbi:Uncharacterised protein [Mycobacteroides abscessus subsp. massiliense]|nr:Uncharacterised protein [Mycobacteroides abscessus subsp. massiliense]